MRAADSGALAKRVYHWTSTLSLVLTPVAFLTASTILAKPVDIMLSLVFPLHMHIGMNYVFTDYVAKPYRAVARAGMAGLTIVTVLGLLKLSLGPGLTNTVLALWKKKKD
jgi:succinate dehydrogenase (ubiquinone) membrane anchor subunit